MSDRHLFRGKWAGEWYYGGYYAVQHESLLMHYITTLSGGRFDINPATIGQCTGLTDKNGKLIFEGDIVQWEYKGCKENGIVKWDSYKWIITITHIPYVEWTLETGRANTCVVIGSVHDNLDF